jgi:hypothetical protein
MASKAKRGQPKPEQAQIQGGTLDKADAEKLHDRLGGQLTEWLRLETSRIEQRVDLRMDGISREVGAKLDAKPGLGAMMINSVVIVGVILAVLAYAADRFNGGMSATGALAQQEVGRAERDAALDKQLKEIKLQLNTMQQTRAEEREK